MTLKTMVLRFFEMLLTVFQLAWHNLSEDLYLQSAAFTMGTSGLEWL